MVPKTILCINDRIGFVSVFRNNFEERGYQVLAASTGMEGNRLLKAPMLVLMLSFWTMRHPKCRVQRHCKLSRASRPKRRF